MGVNGTINKEIKHSRANGCLINGDQKASVSTDVVNACAATAVKKKG